MTISIRGRAFLFGIAAFWVAAPCSCILHEIEPIGDEVYRVRGTVRDSSSSLPLEGVAVAHYDTTDIGDGTQTYAVFEDTVTNEAGYYWIRVDFWMHGDLHFVKDGYESRSFKVTSAPARTSNDHVYALDVLLVKR